MMDLYSRLFLWLILLFLHNQTFIDYQLCGTTRKVQNECAVHSWYPGRTGKDAEGPDSCFGSFEGSGTVTLNLS